MTKLLVHRVPFWGSAALKIWICVAAIGLTLSDVAYAQQGNFWDRIVDRVTGRSSSETETTDADPAVDTDADTTAVLFNELCPEESRDWPRAKLWPASCGLDAPPAEFGQDGPYDGVWDVYSRGLTVVADTVVHIDTQDQGEGPYTSGHGAYRYPDGYTFVGWRFHQPVEVSPNGSFSISMGADNYGQSSVVKWTVSPSGNKNILRGRWEHGEDSGGTIWRRRPPISIESVKIDRASIDETGNYLVDEYYINDRVGKITRQHPVSCGYGEMLGNCGSLTITLSGRNLEGSHDVWIDPAHRMVSKWSWVFANGVTSSSYWYSDTPGVRSGEDVVGMQFIFYLRAGMKRGPMNIWIDGQPIPIYLDITGYPDEHETPKVTSLRAFAPDGEQLFRVGEDSPFKVVASFDEDHPDPWVAIDFADNNEDRQLVVYRTNDPRVYESRWHSVAPSNSAFE